MKEIQHRSKEGMNNNRFLNFLRSLTIKDFIYAVIILLLVGLCVTSIRKCSDNDVMYKNNIEALTDSISYYRSKDGNLVAMKTAFTAEAEELKKLNSDLYERIKSLDVKTKTITNTVYMRGETEFLPQDTVYIVSKDSIVNGVTRDFNFNDEWRDLEGNIRYKDDTLGLNITRDVVRFDYTVAMDKNNKIHIKSNNPYVKYDEISGFQIPRERQKQWGIGPQIGAGITTDGKFRPYIGIGVQWSPIRF